MKSIHPTKQRLIDVTVDLLDEKQPQEIQVDEILDTSGISKGSLYHHFTDLQELLEVALTIRYSRFVDLSIQFMTSELLVKTQEELYQGLVRLTELTQDPKRSKYRFERARAIALAEGNPRFAKMLGEEQARLTAALADIVLDLQNKNLVSKKYNADVVATYIQSYTLGIVINDITAHPIAIEPWREMINDIAKFVFLDKA